VPLVTGSFGKSARTVLAAGYALITWHPVSEAAHYRLFSPYGRSVYLEQPEGDYPWITDQEIATVLFSIVSALTAVWFMWRT
jgi:hypothetical protein